MNQPRTTARPTGLVFTTIVLLGVLVLMACRASEPASPQYVFMRMGYAAPVAGDRAVLQVIEADPTIPFAMIGVRCDDVAQQVRVTVDLTEQAICDVRLRLEEVVTTYDDLPRAVRLSVHWETAESP